MDRLYARQLHLHDEAVLEGAPQALDAAPGFGRVRGYRAYAEFRQGTAELSRLSLTLEFLLERPGPLVMVLEYGVAIVVELPGQAAALQYLPEEEEVALGVFLLAKEGGADFARGVVNGAQESAAGQAQAKPVVVAAVHLQEHALLRPAVSPAAVARRPVALLGLLPAPRRIRRTLERLRRMPSSRKRSSCRWASLHAA